MTLIAPYDKILVGKELKDFQQKLSKGEIKL